MTGGTVKQSKRRTLTGAFCALMAMLCLGAAAPAALGAGTLTVSKSPQSSAGTILGTHPSRELGEPGTATPIDCGATCDAYIDDYEVCTGPEQDICSFRTESVDLDVTAGTGWSFSGWTGACSGTGDCDVLMHSDRSVGASFTDVGAPTVALSGPVAGSKLNGGITFGAVAADNAGVQRVEWFVDGIEAAEDTNGGNGWSGFFSTVLKPHGDFITVVAKAYDAAGNVSSQVPQSMRSYTVDSRTGVHFEDPTPAEGSHVQPAEINMPFAADADTPADTDATFRCEVNGFVIASCTSPVYIDATSDEGFYAVEVTITDEAVPTANVATIQRSFTVDGTPPNLTVTTPANGSLRNSTTLTPAHTVSDGWSPTADIDVTCAVDGAALAPCTTINGLGQGPHTYLARATDLAGNYTEASTSFTVDTIRPDTNISSGPSGVRRSTSATFAFGSTEANSTFTCKLDNGPVTSCTSTKTYSSLAQGTHTFTVRARDAAGNIDSPPATRTWTVDTVGPNTFITSGPSGPVAATAVQFNFNASESGGSFKCSLDNAAFTTCTSPKQYSGLAQGPHTFKVRAYDAAGNADPTSAVRNFTVDTVRPDTTITSGPSGTTTATSATFHFESTEPGTFNCTLDSGQTVPCTSPKSYSGLAPGRHVLTVRARDTAGNFDSPPAARGWTIAP